MAAVNDMFIFYEDDDEELIEFIERVRRPRRIIERPNHFDNLDEKEFQYRFRLSKENVQEIFNVIENDITPRTDRNRAIAPMKKFLMALRFYATGNFLITAGDFGGVSISSACNIVKDVTNALYRRRRNYINMPENPEEIVQLQREFFDLARFPRVVGAIDCTHVRIESPGGDNAEYFRNRKGYFSINVQTVSDAKLKILDLVADWPGSSHDQTIFNNSAINLRFENREFRDALLVGDGGYTNTDFLVTPFPDVNNPEENLYNESIIRTRNVVERSYGVWKRRFPVLHLGIRLKLNTVRKIIWATAILHNIAVDANEGLPPDEYEWDEVRDEVPVPGPGLNQNRNDYIRRFLTDYYFRRMLFL